MAFVLVSLLAPFPLALMALGYASGSIPFGVLVARWAAGVDVRSAGSGNIGATNVARVAGRRLGVAVLLLDALKGALPVLLSMALARGNYRLHSLVGLAAFAGHVWPVWLKFRGGKGVATALGVLAVLMPAAAGAGFAVYALVVAALRLSSVGSILGAVTATSVAFLVEHEHEYQQLTLVFLGLMLFTHRANLRRLLGRTEGRV